MAVKNTQNERIACSEEVIDRSLLKASETGEQ